MVENQRKTGQLKACDSHVMVILRNVLRFIGFDQATGYTFFARSWVGIAGILSVIFVGEWLSPMEQGYYYTFASLLGLQVFFELGLTYVIMQTASHERAVLYLSEGGTFEGDARGKSRLAALLRVAVIWYAVIGFLFVLGLIPGGMLFLSRNAGEGGIANWRLAWIWTVIAAGGNLFLSAMLSFLEGSGFLPDIAKLRLMKAVASNVFLWLALTSGLGVISAAVFGTANLVCATGWLSLRYSRLLKDLLFHQNGGETIKWWTDIWPFQWRIAVSWLSGYFIFQFFTPVVFASRGPIEAGRLGMSITMMGLVSTLALSWVTTKAPTFGVLVARRQLKKLDKLFFGALKRSVSVSCLAAIFLLGIVYALNFFNHPFAKRIVQPWPFILLTAATFVSVIVSAEAVYLRSFKQEPFLFVSLLNGILIGISTVYLEHLFGVTGILTGYLVINLFVGLGIGTLIFCKKRKQWYVELR